MKGKYLCQVMLLLWSVACFSTISCTKQSGVTYDQQREQFDSLIEQQRYDKAIDVGHELIPRAQELFGENSSEVASVYSFIGLSLFRQGHYADARQWWEKELAIRQQTVPVTDVDVVEILNNIGHTYYEEGNYTKAWQVMAEIKDRRDQMSSVEPNLYATTISNLGRIKMKLGEFNDAETYLLNAVERYEALPPGERDWSNYVATLQYLVSTYMQQYNYDKALAHVQKALSIAATRLGSQSYEYAVALRTLGHIYVMKENPSADSTLQEAYMLMRQMFPEDDVDVAVVKNYMGVLYAQQGQMELADKYLSEALTVMQQEKGETHPTVLYYLVDYGAYLTHAGEYDRAEQLLSQALSIAETALGKNSPIAVTPLQALALLYKTTGKREKEAAALERIRSIHQKTST